MPRNVGSRKRSGDDSASAAKRRRKPTASRRLRGRVGRPVGSFGGTGIARFNNGVVYNRKPDQSLTLKKTLMNASVFNGLGAYVNATGYWTASNFPDWAYCKAMFGQYRVKRVKLVFTLLDITQGDGKAFTNTRMPEIYVRYNYDPGLAAPASSSATQEYNNMISFQMSPERTRAEYIIEPKAFAPVMKAPNGATQGYRPVKQTWTNVADDDVQLWGYMLFVDYLDTSFRIVVDHEYEFEVKADK